jgi:hypothetical protein
MHRALAIDHANRLDRAERHIEAVKKKLTEQIEFIAWLNWFGHDTAGARDLLRDFERSLARHVAERMRLHAELPRFAPPVASVARPLRRELPGRPQSDRSQPERELDGAPVNV